MLPTQMDRILLRTLYLVAVGILLCQTIGFDSLISPLFSATFVIAVLVWLSAAYRRVTWLDVVTIFTIALAFAHVVLNAWITDTALSMGYFKKYIMFSFTLLFFQIANKLTMDRGMVKFLLGLNTFVALFYTVFYFADRDMAFLFKGQITGYLTFRFTNPNLAALFLLCIYMGELLQLFEEQGRASKLFHNVLSCVMGWFILQTQARNCLIVASFVTVMAVILIRRKDGIRTPGWIMGLVVVWPILFVFAYLAIVESSLIQALFSFFAGEGKELSSRVGMWEWALQWYRESPVLGAYSQISRGTGTAQMHNTHLDMMVSYGTVVLVLVCYLLYSVVQSDEKASAFESAARIFFAGTILMGMGEAALFSGGLGLYLWAGMFLLMNRRPVQTLVES